MAAFFSSISFFKILVLGTRIPFCQSLTVRALFTPNSSPRFFALRFNSFLIKITSLGKLLMKEVYSSCNSSRDTASSQESISSVLIVG